MKSKKIVFMAIVSLFAFGNANAATKAKFTQNQLNSAKIKAGLLTQGMDMSKYDFGKMCSKGSAFLGKNTWRSAEGVACTADSIAALVIQKCPAYAKDIEQSHCWNKAVLTLANKEMSLQDIKKITDFSKITESEKAFIGGKNTLGPPPPTDAPPPLPGN